MKQPMSVILHPVHGAVCSHITDASPEVCSSTPEGRLGISDVNPCLESQGCHLIPLFLSLRLSYCLGISLLGVLQKSLKYFSLRVRIFWKALVERLGDDSW